MRDLDIGATTERAVRIPAGGQTLEGDLTIPDGPLGAVIFAHGSGSSRKSAHNRYVAGELHQAGLATLLMDLLTPEEERLDFYTAELRFDIDLLADRLVAATEWLHAQPETSALPVGYLGASTGVGAALIAANRARGVRAIVSRGGRPDMADDDLPHVTAPTLLIVGGEDRPVLSLNQEAMAHMHTDVRLVAVAGASHQFEEPGALEAVAGLAREWFEANLRR